MENNCEGMENTRKEIADSWKRPVGIWKKPCNIRDIINYIRDGMHNTQIEIV